MTTMRRKRSFAIALFTLSALLFTQCSKNNGDNNPGGADGTLSAKIGGKLTTFNFDADARQDDPYTLAIVGHTARLEQGKESQSLQLVISQSAEKITAKTYTLDATGYTMLVTYGTVKADGSQANFSASRQSASPYDVFTIKIDAIDGKSVKGSFSGKVVQQTGPTTTAVVEVAEGRFDVPVR